MRFEAGRTPIRQFREDGDDNVMLAAHTFAKVPRPSVFFAPNMAQKAASSLRLDVSTSWAGWAGCASASLPGRRRDALSWPRLRVKETSELELGAALEARLSGCHPSASLGESSLCELQSEAGESPSLELTEAWRRIGGGQTTSWLCERRKRSGLSLGESTLA